MRAHHLCLAMKKSSSAAVSCSRLTGMIMGEVVGGGNVGGEVLVELEYEVPVSMGVREQKRAKDPAQLPITYHNPRIPNHMPTSL